MSTGLARQGSSQQGSVASLLTRPEIQQQIALALPKQMTPERLLRIALTEVRRNPKLAKCSQESLLGAVFQCAQLGLEPGGGLGHAYLIPYKNEVSFQIGYRGMLDLARRSGQIRSIEAHVVYEGDRFEATLGLESNLVHEPDWGNSNRNDAKKITFAYAVAHLIDGGRQFEVLSKGELDAAKRRSLSGSSGPWASDYPAMARKTAVRRLFKWLPMSIEIAKAVELDEAPEAGQRQGSDLDSVLYQDDEAIQKVEVVDAAPAKAKPSRPTMSEQQQQALLNSLNTRLSEPAQRQFLSELGVGSVAELDAEAFDKAMRSLTVKENVARWETESSASTPEADS